MNDLTFLSAMLLIYMPPIILILLFLAAAILSIHFVYTDRKDLRDLKAKSKKRRDELTSLARAACKREAIEKTINDWTGGKK